MRKNNSSNEIIDDEIGAKYRYTPNLKNDLYASAASSAVCYFISAFLLGYGIYSLSKQDPNVLSSVCSLFMSFPITALGSAELALSIDAAEKLREQKQNKEIEQ